jgi:hypothetical protein
VWSPSSPPLPRTYLVFITIVADESVFQFYESGVFDSTSCRTILDYGVYSTLGGEDCK